MVPSPAALARSAEAPLCLAHRCATTLDGQAESPVRSDSGRGPCGWLRACCSERNHGCRARVLLELAADVPAPSLQRARVVDALLTDACAQARRRRGSDG